VVIPNRKSKILSSPLTNHQKRRLAQLAREAHRAYLNSEDCPDQPLSADEFRHHHCHLACDKPGLTLATQSDYKAIESHFLQLLGRHQAAFQAQLRHATESRRLVEFKLDAACQQWRLNLAYANKICQRQYKCDLADATEKQLWRLVYTINNRGRAKSKHNQQEHIETTSVSSC